MKRTLFLAAALLVCSTNAVAQTNPCTESLPTTVTFSPNRIYFASPDHLTALPDGTTPKLTEYVIAYFDSAVVPADSGQAAGPLTLPKANITLVAGTTDCYTASIPIPVPQVNRPLIASVKSRRAATGGLPLEDSAWSAVSNPFAPAPTVLQRPGQPRIRFK